jgi:hypothetical protein
MALAFTPWSQAQEWRTLDDRMHHLGNDATPEWQEAPAEPEPAPLEIAFESRANQEEWLLEAAARDVSSEWALELNGKSFATLKHGPDELRVARYAVPKGLIRNGRNVLSVRPVSNPNDDILVGRVRLAEASLRQLERLGRVTVSVTDLATGKPLPARIAVADADGNLAPIYYAERPLTAVRPGIAYTSDGRAVLEVPAGEWQVWASRGMEWGVDSDAVAVTFGGEASIALTIGREVDTRGWIAADTHIHTLTHSGHGDASVEERLVTLAGEGVELAIATDHNHQTDYLPLQKQLGLKPWFTPVVGNEVTTDNGHMNAFPFAPEREIPPYEETDWKKLVAGIRARGAQVVILNHPRWPEEGKDPLTAFGFDETTGRNAAGQEFTFDCIEIVNSDCPTSPPRAILPVWFALLERGQRFTAVGSSDSHTVGVIVGQGRTYVPSATDDPARVEVDAACEAFRNGRVSVSLGMFATIAIEGRGMGDTLRARGEEVEALVRVRQPSWVAPRRLELVVNGQVAATVALDDAQPGDTANLRERRVRLTLPRAKNWIVAVASGDKVVAPFWPMSQPESMAITNPVFVER